MNQLLCTSYATMELESLQSVEDQETIDLVNLALDLTVQDERNDQRFCVCSRDVECLPCQLGPLDEIQEADLCKEGHLKPCIWLDEVDNVLCAKGP